MADGAPRQTSPHPFTGRDLGDEYLFYDPDADRVHILNGTARAIYLLCDGERGLDEIALSIAERYEVDRDTAIRDCAETIERLKELGLVDGA
jgi:hypothetical protein